MFKGYVSHGWKTSAWLLIAVPILAISGARLHAQSTPAQTFDVVSIKLDRSMSAGSSMGGGLPGKFSGKYIPLLTLIEYAYDVKDAQVEGLPGWGSAEKYDVDAKMDDEEAAREKSLSYDERERLSKTRVQALLADRFGLKLHHETKDETVLALMVAKGGPKFNEQGVAPTRGDPHSLGGVGLMYSPNGKLVSNRVPLRMFINALSSQPEINGHMLVDRTGLTGNYTFTLQWTPQNLSGGAAASSEAPGPSLFTALEEQLGLRLESTKAPVDVLVIDRVEKPSPN
jgi:uncharacterized protein (TIGR03435 family)